METNENEGSPVVGHLCKETYGTSDGTRQHNLIDFVGRFAPPAEPHMTWYYVPKSPHVKKLLSELRQHQRRIGIASDAELPPHIVDSDPALRISPLKFREKSRGNAVSEDK
ncbi:hypothetical protein RJJ37_29720 [Rhizobium redzepovicii]|uniref:Uncharacterized protein n=1 Tax=Rhizobium redzepovicii TaxID=2867518 RepID=A0AAW8P9R4_9HYPH|nr:hypothetical protein [Rhizobium redzepovicii]MDR9763758.1 hypothetical protein [Rhizobium redzepovicii]